MTVAYQPAGINRLSWVRKVHICTIYKDSFLLAQLFSFLYFHCCRERERERERERDSGIDLKPNVLVECFRPAFCAGYK